jgi:hypothetical protein
VRAESWGDPLVEEERQEQVNGAKKIEDDTTVGEQTLPPMINGGMQTVQRHSENGMSQGSGIFPGSSSANGGASVGRPRRNAIIGPAWRYDRL